MLLVRDDIRRPAATRAHATPFLVLPRIARSSRGSARIHERPVSSAKRVASVAAPRATSAPSLYNLADAMVTLAGEACAGLGPTRSSVERGYHRRDHAGLLLQQPSGDGGDEWHDGHRRARVHSACTSIGRERRSRVTALTGAVGAPAGPERRGRDPASSGASSTIRGISPKDVETGFIDSTLKPVADPEFHQTQDQDHIIC